MSATDLLDYGRRAAAPAFTEGRGGLIGTPLLLIGDLSAAPGRRPSVFGAMPADRARWIWPGCILLGIALSIGVGTAIRALAHVL